MRVVICAQVYKVALLSAMANINAYNRVKTHGMLLVRGSGACACAAVAVLRAAGAQRAR